MAVSDRQTHTQVDRPCTELNLAHLPTFPARQIQNLIAFGILVLELITFGILIVRSPLRPPQTPTSWEHAYVTTEVETTGVAECKTDMHCRRCAKPRQVPLPFTWRRALFKAIAESRKSAHRPRW